ncbi:MAG: bifunctional nuclease family protein [Bacteroidota bacterium]|nr:bifunctional nuclease family protein [Bacteroidota bacterium]
MKKVDLEIHDISLTGSSSGAYTMVMGVVGGAARIPVVIGGAEAQSIALELENMKSSRPLTHDMYKSTLVAFGMKVDEVLVYKFEEGIFYAKVIVSNGKTTEEIDSRISDAVGVAVRFRAPVRCYESIVKQAGINPQELSSGLVIDIDIDLGDGDDHISLDLDSTPDLELLEAELKEAIDNEDYELASELRDQIDKIKNKNKDE